MPKHDPKSKRNATTFTKGDPRASAAAQKQKRGPSMSAEAKAELLQKEREIRELRQRAAKNNFDKATTLDRIRELEPIWLDALKSLLEDGDPSIVRWVGSRIAPEVTVGDEELQRVLEGHQAAMEAMTEENARLQERLELYGGTPAMAQAFDNAQKHPEA